MPSGSSCHNFQIYNQVAVVSCSSKKPYHSLKVLQFCYIFTRFYFFPAFSPMFWTFFKNTATTATTLKKIIDIKRYLKIIEVFKGSSCGSSLVAVGSSCGSSRRGVFWTATNFNYLKSISYRKVAVVAVFFIRAYKSQFLPLLRVILTIKNTLVAVGFIDNIFSFQSLKRDKKLNCYQSVSQRNHFLLYCCGFFYIRSYFPFNHLKNRLLVVCMRRVVSWFRGLKVKGLYQFCAGSRLGVMFMWFENRPKKAKCKPKRQVFLTAHNYKKCDSGFYRHNKISRLQIVDVKKSVVGFEIGQKLSCVLDCVRGSEGYPQ